MNDPEFINRLGAESSPYLRQHADNPVAWYPWGEEAFARARQEGKAVFLSIGYSACHWCHVMAHESFEDAATAEIMNRLFINIKVDREERPDLDQIYQASYQLLVGRGGGWPLSMFLTPEQAPFWGGTYFPNVPRYGMPAFRDVLSGVSKQFTEQPDDVAHNAKALADGLAKMNAVRGEPLRFSDLTLEAACNDLAGGFDAQWGGFGGAPKFPGTMALSLLLRRAERTDNTRFRHVVTHSLEKMADGGIHDHLGGGFARYSVDAEWHVPHFEKMLYDNALLAPLYIDAWRATENPRFATVARGILDFVQRDLMHPDGGCFAALDADTEGEEGRFYVWRPGEVEEVVGEELYPLFSAAYDISDTGNFEGQNVLWHARPLAEVAADFGRSVEDVEAQLAPARQRLLAVRAQRVAPGLDHKVIASWNGLMLSAYAQAAVALGDAEYLAVAERLATFLAERLSDGDRLLRCWTDGVASGEGFLDDYAFVAQGLLTLYGATGNAAHFTRAQGLIDQVLDRFAATSGGFHFTGSDQEALITRPLSAMDQSIPSGNAVAAECLVRLHHLTGDGRYLTAAENTVAAFFGQAATQPLGYAHLLAVLDELIHPPRIVVLSAPADDPERATWHQRLAQQYRSGTHVVWAGSGDAPAGVTDKPPVNGQITAYVCAAGTCGPPATNWEELVGQLDTTEP